MGTLRTTESEARYQVAIAAGLTKPLKDVDSLMEWKYWRLIPNEFPHSLIAKEHDLLIPIRVFPTLEEATMEEIVELMYILFNDLVNNYDSVKLNFPRQQTVRNHLHFHLMVYL